MKKLKAHVLLFALLASLAGCGEETSEPGAQGDPSSAEAVAEIQAVTKKFKSAAAERDWETFLSCMDVESQYTFVGMTISMTQLFSISADESEKKSLNELLKRHGIEQPAKGGTRMKMSFKGVDKAALVGDILGWWEKNAPPAEGTTKGASPVKDLAEMEISDVKVDGDTATATTNSSKETEKAMYFKKVGGKWYIDYATTVRKAMENMKRPPSGKKP